MKIKIFRMLFVLLLSTSITACSFASTTTSSVTSDGKNDSVPAKTPSDTTTNPTDMALKAYKAVLQNKGEFINTANKKNVYLNDFLADNGSFDCVFKTLHFAVLDMDGDMTPEVVIQLAVGSNDYAEFYEVLHYMNGKVYGYIQVLRGLESLKVDGTFSYSNGARDNGFGRLRFQDSNSITDPIGYEESNGSNNQDEAYFIDDKQVTPDKYHSFEKEQLAKKDATWYEFSQDSIDNELSTNS